MSLWLILSQAILCSNLTPMTWDCPVRWLDWSYVYLLELMFSLILNLKIVFPVPALKFISYWTPSDANKFKIYIFCKTLYSRWLARLARGANSSLTRLALTEPQLRPLRPSPCGIESPLKLSELPLVCKKILPRSRSLGEKLLQRSCSLRKKILSSIQFLKW